MEEQSFTSRMVQGLGGGGHRNPSPHPSYNKMFYHYHSHSLGEENLVDSQPSVLKVLELSPPGELFVETMLFLVNARSSGSWLCLGDLPQFLSTINIKLMGC